LKLAILVFDIYHGNCPKKRIVDLGKFALRIGLRAYCLFFAFPTGSSATNRLKKP
jgi:hypothetical protein